MEAVVGDAALRHARERRHVNVAAVGVGQGRPDVVVHDDQDVWRALGQPARRGLHLVNRLLDRRPGLAGGGRRLERQAVLRQGDRWNRNHQHCEAHRQMAYKEMAFGPEEQISTHGPISCSLGHCRTPPAAVPISHAILENCPYTTLLGSLVAPSV